MIYNFAHNVNPIHDIQTQVSNVTCAVPEYEYIQKILVKNAGTISESNIQLGYSHDEQVLYGAAIYFDFNEPILTNTIINSIDWPEYVNETNNKNKITVFPNPISGIFTVFGENIKQVELFNSLGQKILISQSAEQIDISNLKSGVYFVLVNYKGGSVYKELIKY
jgi:hypothetical protein